MKKILLLTCLVITACSTLQTAPTDSGIEGQVFIGPTCPVVREGEACPDRPYQAVLTVIRPDGRKVTHFETDNEGRFHVALPPGEYILHPESPQNMPLPFAGEQSFIVREGEYTILKITYDSGIR